MSHKRNEALRHVQHSMHHAVTVRQIPYIVPYAFMSVVLKIYGSSALLLYK